MASDKAGMIEADSNLDTLIDRLTRHADRLRTSRAKRRERLSTAFTRDWRSAASLWPGFAQDGPWKTD